jgi:hypothetical protein
MFKFYHNVDEKAIPNKDKTELVMIYTPPLWLVFRITGQWRYGRFVRFRQPSRPAKIPLPGRLRRGALQQS